MLSKDENELLTHTGPGTPMGELFRRFWLPALLADELPGPDCPPIRVRLLGEDLVAIRDSAGRAGLVGQHCPHRGASLFFGRNEEDGLRCVYHGWKFDVTGQCVDMPNEPTESSFKSKVRATAYACIERSGVVWTYLGPPDRVPQPPDLEWARVPETHVVVSKYVASCNYMQAMEGDIDSAHVSFLHKRLDALRMAEPGALSMMALLTTQDRAPRFVVKDTDYGLMIGARRDAGDDRYYWRISQWLMPAFDMIGHDPGVAMSGHALVPMDDEHVWFWAARWEGDRPMTGEEHAQWSQEGARVAVGAGGLVATRKRGERLPTRPRGPADSELHRHPRHRRAGPRRHREHGADRRPHPRAPGHDRPGDHRSAAPAPARGARPPTGHRAVRGAAPRGLSHPPDVGRSPARRRLRSGARGPRPDDRAGLIGAPVILSDSEGSVPGRPRQSVILSEAKNP